MSVIIYNDETKLIELWQTTREGCFPQICPIQDEHFTWYLRALEPYPESHHLN